MRDIKFRAWHEDHKEMVIFDMDKASKDPYISGAICQLMSSKSEHLMQYTGLKDKNDIEIYEGDIVNVRARMDSVIGVVDFHESTFVFKIPVDEHSLASPYRDLKTGWYGIEVIGNIYENPELLGKANG